ncbi:MAG: hypothetical protein R2932_56650 [Caldilineaceae bacterium]
MCSRRTPVAAVGTALLRRELVMARAGNGARRTQSPAPHTPSDN